MAYARTDGLYAKQQRVGVAIDTQFQHLQKMSAGFALSPQPVPGTAEENSLPRPLRLRESLFIHEAEHEHIPGGMVLNNRRHQPVVLFKFDLHRPAFPKLTAKKQKTRWAFLRQRAEECFVYRIAIRTTADAALGRDDDGADASEK